MYLRGIKLSETRYDFKDWRKVQKCTYSKCLSEITVLQSLNSFPFSVWDSLEIIYDKDKKIENSHEKLLSYARYFELPQVTSHTEFLAANGLYRNAFDNIRYVLESIVQAVYIDTRHPKASLNTKVEILKEVEDKIEYHAIRLIDELQINHKDKLKKEYKRLSQSIHPSHKQITATWNYVKLYNKSKVPTTIDKEELKRIIDSSKIMYDIFFYLFLPCCPEVIGVLNENKDFKTNIVTYQCELLAPQFCNSKTQKC